MPDPLSSLIVASVLLGFVALLFWPEWGLVAKWRRLRGMTSRILQEDVLKHILKEEMEGRKPTLITIAGALNIDLNRTSSLLEAMGRNKLVHWVNGQLRLTPAGRDYGLHIMRAHRLWERHLADKTGVTATEWHTEAEHVEHYLSPEEVETLSTTLGHPTYDPHGDPIPQASGVYVDHKGKPLPTLDVDQAARIVHLEDEPETVYAQLIAEGLTPGMEVRILEKGAERISFWADGDEHVVAPIIAQNISVIPLLETDNSKQYSTVKLSDLKAGEAGRVLHISRTCRGVERRRLLDLGITRGAIIRSKLSGLGNDPIAYSIRGALIALRKEQARLIHIERLEGDFIDHEPASSNNVSV